MKRTDDLSLFMFNRNQIGFFSAVTAEATEMTLFTPIQHNNENTIATNKA